MPEIKPFLGWYFSPAAVSNLDDVVTPPYDVITPEERARLARLSPYNMVHLILPQERYGCSRYEAAANDLGVWMESNVLVQDASPYLYVLRQEFTDTDGKKLTRHGFFALAKLPEKDERSFLGHERTFSGPVEDRLLLLQATRTQLEPIFVLYADPEGQTQPLFEHTTAKPPEMRATTHDGVTHSLWRVSVKEDFVQFFKDQTLYIADGHHRFRTACLFRDELRQRRINLPAGEYIMAVFTPLEDPGLKIYPTHRILERMPGGITNADFLARLREAFEVEPSDETLYTRIMHASGKTVLGMCLQGEGCFLLTLKESERARLTGTDRAPAWHDLDVVVLHRGIFEHILGLPEGSLYQYEKDAQAALTRVRSGAAAAAFLLRPTRADQIRACAEAGEPMPQKSTYFYPKLPSGMVLYRLA
jgi:uncharacterized protein (DUF1015 family)